MSYSKARFCILFLVLGLLVGCAPLELSDIELHAPSASFDEPVGSASRSFPFLVFTDLHFGRDDSGVYWKHEVFLDWLDSYPTTLEFALNLGDMTSDSREIEYRMAAAFLQELENRGVPSHSLVGNHDVRDGGRTLFRSYIHAKTARRFSYGGISFYLLDSGNASLGRTQLRTLIDQASSDHNPKIFCSHIPFYAGPDMYYFGLSDAWERTMLVNTMVKAKVGLVLSGHLHLTEKVHHFTEENAELVCASFHGRDSLFEQTLPTWYVCSYDQGTRQLTVTRFQVTDEDRITTHVIATFAIPS
nr:metallophosphoesterase [uncultured Sphaerochaeta sp.]